MTQPNPKADSQSPAEGLRQQIAVILEGLASHYEVDEIMKLVTAYAATVEREADGCPCLLIEPCSYACSCAKPIMSGGCMRCCKYGSLEQRKASADRLAALQGPQDGDD